MDKKTSEKRRKLIKSIAAGSGAVVAGKSLPENWSKPLVNSVVIPAHAQTSTMVYAANLSNMVSYDSGIRQAGSDSRLMDALMPEAKAQAAAPVDFLCIIVTGNFFDARFARQYSDDQVNVYKATGGTLGKELELPFSDGCGNAITPTLTASNPDGTGVEFILDPGDALVTGTLPPGDCSILPAAVCNVESDINIKDNFAPVDEQDILRKVASLPIETWNYTDRENGVRHIGPMAQDFMASFNVGDSDRHINMVDANGVNLAAIKALNARLEEKDTQIRSLQEQLNRVLDRLERLS